MSDPLDIVRCAACRRETYAGQETCPHCKLKLIPVGRDDNELSETALVEPEFAFQEFVGMHRNGQIDIVLDRKKLKGLDFYPLFPTHYIVGIVAIIAAISVVVMAFLVGLSFLGQTAPEFLEEDVFSVMFFYAMSAAITGLFVFRNSIRLWRVRRRILRDAEFYWTCISQGYARLEKREG